MQGRDFRAIRKRLGLSKDLFALQLGYRGNDRNNMALINRYERGTKKIPLTVASLAWLIDQYRDMTGHLPPWPYWPGYEIELGPVVPAEEETLDSA